MAAVSQRDNVFRVGDAYKVEVLLGEGAYGTVCSAIHRQTGKRVAIKKMSPFGPRHSGVFALRTLREIKLLRFFQHDNIVQILELVQPASYEGFDEVYLVQELMHTDLHKVVKTQKLSNDHCQYFVYQILRGLKYMHSANVVHRDLKPSNLLLNANCDLKICDFGLARVMDEEHDVAGVGMLTEYVATRWYRAPEIMLTLREYTKAVDMWSVGCIMSEMITGKPLFPGVDYWNQLVLIFNVIGSPSAEDLARIRRERSRSCVQRLPKFSPRPMESVHPTASPHAVALLQRLLTFDPSRRISADDALTHAYVAAYHDPADEPSAPPMPLWLVPPSLITPETLAAGAGPANEAATKFAAAVGMRLPPGRTLQDRLKTMLYNEIMTPDSYYAEVYACAQRELEFNNRQQYHIQTQIQPSPSLLSMQPQSHSQPQPQPQPQPPLPQPPLQSHTQTKSVAQSQLQTQSGIENTLQHSSHDHHQQHQCQNNHQKHHNHNHNHNHNHHQNCHHHHHHHQQHQHRNHQLQQQQNQHQQQPMYTVDDKNTIGENEDRVTEMKGSGSLVKNGTLEEEYKSACSCSCVVGEDSNMQKVPVPMNDAVCNCSCSTLLQQQQQQPSSSGAGLITDHDMPIPEQLVSSRDAK